MLLSGNYSCRLCILRAPIINATGTLDNCNSKSRPDIFGRCPRNVKSCVSFVKQIKDVVIHPHASPLSFLHSYTHLHTYGTDTAISSLLSHTESISTSFIN